LNALAAASIEMDPRRGVALSPLDGDLDDLDRHAPLGVDHVLRRRRRASVALTSTGRPATAATVSIRHHRRSDRQDVSRLSLVATFADITRHDDFDPDDDVWVGSRPVATPIAVVDPDPSWPAQFDELADRIRLAVGDQVLELEHVGSTSVAGLPAKPIIDIDLTVIDSSDEPAYVPELERVGFVLRIREPRWHEHRCLVAPSPRANLHVWSPDSPEAIRHRMFRDWLRDHRDDRVRYAAAKRASAVASNAAEEEVMAYNLRKQPVVSRNSRPHVPRPRHAGSIPTCRLTGGAMGRDPAFEGCRSAVVVGRSSPWRLILTGAGAPCPGRA
jgi:GrpB-like predicted nucleotidyltransferase (UPF0157 family)